MIAARRPAHAGSSRHAAAVTIALVATLAWGVLAFGAVYPWAYWPLAAASVVTGIVGWLVGRSGAWTERPLAFALAAIALMAALQAVPLPRAVLEALSPATLRYLKAYDLRWMYGIGVDTSAHAISLNPAKTLLGIALLGSFSILLLGTARALARTGPAAITGGLVVLGTIVALVGIVQGALTADQLAYDVKIYGFWTPQNRATPYGPFVNRNHYAGWVIMVLPLALAYLTALLEEGLSHVRPTLRDRLLWMGSPAGGRAWLLGLAVAVMALSLLLSQSRSGPAALALAVAGAAAAVARRSGRWRRTVPVMMALAALGALLVIWAGAQTGLARMGDVSTEIGGRLSAWGDALRIVAAFPVFGTGLNTYGAASLLYQTTSLTAHYREAHNDYLQLAAEGGVWLGIPILFAAWQFVRLARARFQAPHATPARYWLRAGAVTALVAIALQSLVEFSLQMPGNAALFAVVAALAIYTEREAAAPENHMVARHRATRGHR